MDTERKNTLFYKELGAVIRSQRDALGYSLEQVAQDSDCGFSRSTLSLIELGEQQVYAHQLFELSKILRFSVSDIFQKIDRMILGEKHPEIKKML